MPNPANKHHIQVFEVYEMGQVINHKNIIIAAYDSQMWMLVRILFLLEVIW